MPRAEVPWGLAEGHVPDSYLELSEGFRVTSPAGRHSSVKDCDKPLREHLSNQVTIALDGDIQSRTSADHMSQFSIMIRKQRR